MQFLGPQFYTLTTAYNSTTFNRSLYQGRSQQAFSLCASCHYLTIATLVFVACNTEYSSSSLSANSRVERCRTDDLMPNVPISCLPPSRVDSEVQGLKVIIDCPQPGSSRATYRPPPISRWSKCDGSDTAMVPLGSGTSKVSKETQPE